MASADPHAAESDVLPLLGGRPIVRPRLYAEVMERIEALIAAGRLRAGDRLPSERELMRAFGVGRPSIREALFALRRKGVLATSAGARPVVSEPTATGIVGELSAAVGYYVASERGMRQFQLARRLVEPALARHAARHASAGDVETLDGLLAANRAALDDQERFVETDMAFHLGIVSVAQSELISALHDAVFKWLRGQRARSIRPPGSPQAAVAAHRRVLDAIKGRDADAAERAMAAHLDEVERFYWAADGAADAIPPQKKKQRRTP